MKKYEAFGKINIPKSVFVVHSIPAALQFCPLALVLRLIRQLNGLRKNPKPRSCVLI